MAQRFDAYALLDAYSRGVFPMAQSRDDASLFLLDPNERGILPLDGLHVSRSLRKSLRRPDHRIDINRDFAATVRACAASAPGREDTWINATIEKLYQDLHEIGHAHSVEVYDLDNRLVGGLYGVSLGGAFFGESMFSIKTDASKIALYNLVERLRERDFQLLDMQFMTPHLASLGGMEIDRADYHERLAKALFIDTRFD